MNASGRITVLLVDDHALFREGLRQILQTADDIDCVASVGSGKEAIAIASKLRPDIALVDIAMPEMDGIETCKRIKVGSPNTSPVILSAFKDNNYVLASLRAEVSGYLLKNMHPHELIESIRMIHHGEGVFSLEATRDAIRQLESHNVEEESGSPVLRSRELEILKLAAQGMTNEQIGRELSISPHTVSSHFVNIFRKLRVESRTEAVTYALSRNLINGDDLFKYVE